jgi:3-oxoacyl-[acyl-carrier-protein] synthase III
VVRAIRASRILGVGAYRPARVVTNDEICTRIDSSDTWIRRRTGVVSRRFAGLDETIVSMAADATSKALVQSGTDPHDVDLIVLASMSRLEQSPPAAPRVAEQIGAERAGALDINAACAGFCYALALADASVRTGQARRVVVVGSERMSDVVDPTDRSTAFLFGDGAGAVVVGESERPGLGPVAWGSDGRRHELIAQSGPWAPGRNESYLRMAGPEVFRWATYTVPRISAQALDAAGVAVEDLAAFIPHQANLRIVESVARALRLGPHTVVARDLVHSGNTSAASIPLAMEDLVSSRRTAPGGLALLVGFGAGLTYAAQVATLP